jgi:hypothetical protein
MKGRLRVPPELEEFSHPAVPNQSLNRASGEALRGLAGHRAAPIEMTQEQRRQVLDLVAGTYRKDRMVWDSEPSRD